MNSKTPYTYTVLRYVHDIATGEFLNVGVALFAPERRFVNAMCRTNFTRLKAVFPSLDGDSFRASMRHVMACFERFGEEAREQLALRSPTGTVMDYALAVLARDDSSLQWSEAGSGVTADPEAMLAQLFERFVTSHDPKAPTHRKDDDDVWRHFSGALQQRQVLKHFDRKTIGVKDDEVEFKHAWKNGEWHCLAPVSFDLANADSIREKAHRWLGQVTSVANSSEPFRLYFLVAEPTQSELRPAYESALSILRKAPVQKEVFAESQAPELSERFAAEVAAHERQGAAGHR
ncbi:MAG: DUF3037 domain-containing protein [Rubrivivax sp.]|nr:DUF3037 domain-containing protein [Rubrivivax sp.]